MDKPPLDYFEMERRLGQFAADQRLWLTRASTFVEKSRLFPGAKVTILLPIIIIPFIFSVPAIAFTAVWFGLQVWQGTSAMDAASGAGGIAWWAHIVGFLAGLALITWMGGTPWRNLPPPPRNRVFVPSGLRLRRGPWSRGPWG